MLITRMMITLSITSSSYQNLYFPPLSSFRFNSISNAGCCAEAGPRDGRQIRGQWRAGGGKVGGWVGQGLEEKQKIDRG